VTPEEIKKIIIKKAGTSRGGAPAIERFCGIYGMGVSSVQQHLSGARNPGRASVALYRVLSESDHGPAMAIPRKIRNLNGFKCECHYVLAGKPNFCSDCGASLIWKK
jgi:hypothetical protein